MRKNIFGLLGLIAALSLANGCDDPTASSSAPTTRPDTVAAGTTQPSQSTLKSGQLAAQSAAIPAAIANVRPPTVFTIDGQPVEFPTARMVVVDRTGGITLRICSEDPPEAIDPGYAGNSFSLDMHLCVDHPADISTTSWDFKPSDAGDAVSGIFVHGYKDGYRPYNIHVVFQKADGETLAYITGKFLRNDSQSPAGLSEQAEINGCVRVDHLYQ